MCDNLPAWHDWLVTPIPGGPKKAQAVIRGLAVDHTGEAWDFRDRWARPVQIPRDSQGTRHGRDGDYQLTTPACPRAYAEACWDLTQGCLLLDEQGAHLYRKRVDPLGAATDHGWERVESIADTYGAKQGEADPSWDAQLKVEAAKLTTDMTAGGTPRRVRRGVKFSDRVYCRIDGHVTVIREGDSAWRAACDQAWLLAVPCEWDDELAHEASRLLAGITDGGESHSNLVRLFATPLLEPYKHLSYVLWGRGGNGKSLVLGAIARSFPDSCSGIDAGTLLHGKGFEKQQEAHRLIGRLWAYDDDADDIRGRDMTELKKLSTGGVVSARLIGRNAVAFAPECTLAVATNGAFISDSSAASDRRYVFIRMRDGRRPEEFLPLVDHIREHGALGFLMASCDLWATMGDEPCKDVVIGDSEEISEEEQRLVDLVIEGGGYTPAVILSDLWPRVSDRADALAHLGLRRVSHRINGHVTKCVGIADEGRFAPYRAAHDEPVQGEAFDPVPVPDGGDVPAPDAAPDMWGFGCDYVPARPDKVAVGWKTRVASQADTSVRPDTPVHAVVPRAGWCVLDLDRGRQGGEDGWEALQHAVGSYGSQALPRTYAVATPSGGMHLYYAVPEALQGRLKDTVHAGGVPIDMRAEGRGYVIGAGSQTDAGAYTLVDVPEGGQVIPGLSPRLCEWLGAHGYVDGGTGAVAGLDRIMGAASTRATDAGGAKADMTPIPEGQRNTTLYKWAFGRLANHPDNAANIRGDFYQRGRASGLGDRELDATWRSVLRGVGEAVGA